eukprot:GHVT01078586.1.p1 GENE.GHVT01078586.1~~GHVT01078586.1.p1  ORF type:complete len:492 (+),score=98.97 GHVT01078586.1:157-1476(+)
MAVTAASAGVAAPRSGSMAVVVSSSSSAASHGSVAAALFPTAAAIASTPYTPPPPVPPATEPKEPGDRLAPRVSGTPAPAPSSLKTLAQTRRRTFRRHALLNPGGTAPGPALDGEGGEQHKGKKNLHRPGRPETCEAGEISVRAGVSLGDLTDNALECKAVGACKASDASKCKLQPATEEAQTGCDGLVKRKSIVEEYGEDARLNKKKKLIRGNDDYENTLVPSTVACSNSTSCGTNSDDIISLAFPSSSCSGSLSAVSRSAASEIGPANCPAIHNSGSDIVKESSPAATGQCLPPSALGASWAPAFCHKYPFSPGPNQHYNISLLASHLSPRDVGTKLRVSLSKISDNPPTAEELKRAFLLHSHQSNFKHISDRSRVLGRLRDICARMEYLAGCTYTSAPHWRNPEPGSSPPDGVGNVFDAAAPSIHSILTFKHRVKR